MCEKERKLRLGRHMRRQIPSVPPPLFLCVCVPILHFASLVSIIEALAEGYRGEGKEGSAKSTRAPSPTTRIRDRRCQLRYVQAISRPGDIVLSSPSALKMLGFQVGVKRVVDYAVRIRVAADNKGVDLSNVS